MPRLFISAEFVQPGRVGGTEQALEYLLDGLVAAKREGDEVTVVGEMRAAPDEAVIASPPRAAKPRFVQETLSYRALARRADCYYFPNYFLPPWPRRCRTIVTIPDLQYRHLPEHFSRRKRAWLVAAHWHTLRRADGVTVYSTFVREDLEAHYGTSAVGRVEVVPIPVSWERFGPAALAPPLDRRIVLAVASHYKHKNLGTLVRAFDAVRRSQPDAQLVLVGQLGANLVGVRQTENVAALIDQLGLGDSVRATGYITPHELGALYRSASLFVFPSIFEGFGLPPVEALGFGLPVITTRCASLPEVTRGLADLVDDPFSVEELAALIVERLDDGRRPTTAQVDELRAYYSPKRIGGVMYELLSRSG